MSRPDEEKELEDDDLIEYLRDDTVRTTSNAFSLRGIMKRIGEFLDWTVSTFKAPFNGEGSVARIKGLVYGFERPKEPVRPAYSLESWEVSGNDAVATSRAQIHTAPSTSTALNNTFNNSATQIEPSGTAVTKNNDADLSTQEQLTENAKDVGENPNFTTSGIAVPSVDNTLQNKAGAP